MVWVCPRLSSGWDLWRICPGKVLHACPARDRTIRYAVSMSMATQFSNVTVLCKANVYFDGGVVSHTLLFPDGSKKTLGLIRPGVYVFNTDSPERMELTAGACRVKLSGGADWTLYSEGQAFDVPGDSRFEITVDEGLCQYICSFA